MFASAVQVALPFGSTPGGEMARGVDRNVFSTPVLWMAACALDAVARVCKEMVAGGRAATLATWDAGAA
ncbi:MAG: hypothetical protein H7176_13565 [Bdellovibrionales bacterium]|nr:hypothetical protein [Massilia sp.]